MTEKQSEFLVAARCSNLPLTEQEAILAFELAKMVLENKEPDLRDWAKIQAKYHVKPEPPQLRKPINYTTLTIAFGHCELPKAC